MNRYLEGLARRAVGILNNGTKTPPIDTRTKLEYLKNTHDADHAIADLSTIVGLPSSDLSQLSERLEEIWSDQDAHDVYEKELWPDWFKSHKTINGYESWALRSKAKQIADERKLNAKNKL